MIDAGVGEYLVGDDVGSSVASNTTTTSSTMTDDTLTEPSGRQELPVPQMASLAL